MNNNNNNDNVTQLISLLSNQQNLQQRLIDSLLNVFQGQNQQQPYPIYSNKIEINQQQQTKKRKRSNGRTVDKIMKDSKEKKSVVISNHGTEESSITPDDSISNVSHLEMKRLYGDTVDRSKYVEVKQTQEQLIEKWKRFHDKYPGDIFTGDEENNNHNNNKDLKLWRNSENYLVIQNSFPMTKNTNYKITRYYINKTLSENEKNKIKLSYRTSLSKCNVGIKIAHEQMSQIADIDIQAHKDKKGVEILKILYQKDPFLYCTYVPNQSSKNPSLVSFKKYHYDHIDYLDYLNLFPGFVYSNISYSHACETIGFRELLRISNDLKTRGFMEEKKTLHFMIAEKMDPTKVPMETETESASSIVSYFKPAVATQTLIVKEKRMDLEIQQQEVNELITENNEALVAENIYPIQIIDQQQKWSYYLKSIWETNIQSTGIKDLENKLNQLKN